MVRLLLINTIFYLLNSSGSLNSQAASLISLHDAAWNLCLDNFLNHPEISQDGSGCMMDKVFCESEYSEKFIYRALENMFSPEEKQAIADQTGSTIVLPGVGYLSRFEAKALKDFFGDDKKILGFDCDRKSIKKTNSECSSFGKFFTADGKKVAPWKKIRDQAENEQAISLILFLHPQFTFLDQRDSRTKINPCGRLMLDHVNNFFPSVPLGFINKSENEFLGISEYLKQIDPDLVITASKNQDSVHSVAAFTSFINFCMKEGNRPKRIDLTREKWEKIFEEQCPSEIKLKFEKRYGYLSLFRKKVDE